MIGPRIAENDISDATWACTRLDHLITSGRVIHVAAKLLRLLIERGIPE